MSGKKLLFVGESWIKQTTHIKGFDHFTSIEYEEGAGVFLKCLDDQGFDVTYIRAHEISARFPSASAELAQYDAVAISDIGSNSFLLTDDTFLRSKVGPNRLQLIADFVAHGGGLVKIGGYMSFTGIDGRARFGMSPLAAVLPVELLPYDDRIELPEGRAPEVVDAAHPIVSGLGATWPGLLGYNKTIIKPGASLLASIGGDPLIAVGQHGAGRVVAFTSDVAPHWAPPEFLQWQNYPVLWGRIVGWASGRVGH
jgi:uncharacterized membrane protein